MIRIIARPVTNSFHGAFLFVFVLPLLTSFTSTLQDDFSSPHHVPTFFCSFFNFAAKVLFNTTFSQLRDFAVFAYINISDLG